MSEDQNKSRAPIGFHRALVTGATGMIGRALVRRLAAGGCQVNALVRDPIQFQKIVNSSNAGNVRVIQGDLTDSASLDQATDGVDAVFHTAAKVHSIPRNSREENEFHRVNVTGTENLLKSCGRQNLRAFIFFSTIAVYGPDAPTPFSETAPCNPEGCYAQTKYKAERHVLNSFQQTSVRAAILRLCLVCGEGERGNFSRMLRGIETGRFLFIGRGESRKSLTYVENVVEAALLAAGSGSAQSEIFNVADPSPYTFRCIVKTAARHLGVPPPRLRLPVAVARAGGLVLDALGRTLNFRPPFTAADVRRFTSDTSCDVSHIRSRLGFEARIGFEEGIARSVEWYRASNSRSRQR